jgi:AraC-like DNA-binding protein
MHARDPIVPASAQEMTSDRGSVGGERGILHPSVAHQQFDYRKHEADHRLAPFVENFWTITWDLRGEEPYTARVLPYPSVNLTVTNDEADVTGLVRSRYDRFLVGQGYVVGARFRPGGFRPFLGSSVSALTDRHRPIANVLGRDTAQLQAAVAEADRDERVTLLTQFLLVGLPDPDPSSELVASLVAEIDLRPEITRVAQVASIARMSERRLQRLFLDYVGAGPKWVILRCRLQEAAARAAADTPPDWAALAVELGFADQAHLTRAFSQTIGTPPAAYAALLRTPLDDRRV